MAFSAQVFRVLIASPSDVDEEREIAVRTIQEWNDLNSSERQLVLLPLRWETHSTPEYGKRPQEVINRQIVDHCDLVVGIFWTRIGSPTGIADSGTIEEIERVASAGKPVMLYFSRARQDPESIDLEQLAKLREFKKGTFPKALIESYAGAIEFKDKLSKQIELQLRTLLAEQSETGIDQIEEIRPITDIVLKFAEPEGGAPVGTSQVLRSQYLNVADFDQIPDYSMADEKDSPNRPSAATNLLIASQTNKDFYRQKVTSLVLKEFFRPLRFSLQNLGGVGARDVYIDLSVASLDGKVTFITKNRLPQSAPTVTAPSYFGSERHPNSPTELISTTANGWKSHIEVAALQPQRQLSPELMFYLGATNSCNVVVTAKIFADTLPVPVVQVLNLQLDVDKIDVNAAELLDEIIRPEGRMEEKLQSKRFSLSEAIIG